MKKIFNLIVLFLIVIVSTGCSFRGCVNCTGTKIKNLLACSLEKSGNCNDLFNFMSCVESCTDLCYVTSCYHMAGCTRKCTRESLGCDGLRENLEKVTEKCNVNFSYGFTGIYNIDKYYKVNITVTVETSEKIKDVVVLFNVSDVNKNRLTYELFIDSKISEGPYNAESAEITFTFAYPENRVPFSSNDYYINFELIDVFGRV